MTFLRLFTMFRRGGYSLPNAAKKPPALRGAGIENHKG